MRIHILPAVFGFVWAQTIFYQQDFNSGVPADWSLNTNQIGGTTTNLFNEWVVGPDYNVPNPTVNVPFGLPPFFPCGSLCQTVTITQVIPNQPSTIPGHPNSPFLHIKYKHHNNFPHSCPPPSGPTTSFLAADGICYFQQIYTANMNTSIAIPPGTQPVKLSFFWLCQGGPDNYGEVYYSTDGINWQGPLTSSVTNSFKFNLHPSVWNPDTITLPITRPTNLWIAFRFFNGVASSANDPSFAVDAVRIFEETPLSSPTIDITSIPPVPTVCAGGNVNVAFSTTGSFGAGNQFTVQLSNAAGSFAAPLATAMGAGSPISLTIPTTVATGSYKIRVVSSNPAVISDTVDVNVVNLSNLTCSASPTNPTTGQAVTFTLNGSGLPSGTFDVSLDIDNNGTPDYTQNGVTLPHSFTHTYTTAGTYTAVFTLTHPGSGCTGTCQVTVNVGAAPTLTLTSIQPGSVCAGATVTIAFNASGSYGTGNTFTAQLSDLSGSFANPTILGSGTSSPISAVVPVTLNSGTYRVRVVSSNPVIVSDTQNLTITNIQSLRCSFTPSPGNAGQPVQVTLTGIGLPSGTLTVSFNPGDGSSPQTQSTGSLPITFTHTYANPGTYNATFTVSEPNSQCVGSCTVPVTIQAPSSLAQGMLSGVRLYPNPSRGNAFLEGVPAGWEIRVVTPLGQVLYGERSEGQMISLPALPQGFYLVEVGRAGTLRWLVLE